MDNEFLIELQAILNREVSEGNINKSILRMQEKIKKLQLQAKIDPGALLKLKTQIEKITNQKITISNIQFDANQTVKNAHRAGKKIGNAVRQGASQELNTNILSRFSESLSNMGMGSREIDLIADKIKGLVVRIDSLNQSRSTGKKDILSVDISGIDQFGQAIKLTQQYNYSTGELIKTIDSVSSAHQKAGTATDSFLDKQKKAVASAKNVLSSLESQLKDPNINKSLAGTDFNLNGLNSQITKVKTAIHDLKQANKDTFTQAKLDVDKETSSLRNLISALKNAEYVATSLRTKNINTVKDQYSSKLDVLTSKMKSSGVYTGGFQKGADNLKNMLVNATDASALVSFLNGLDKLEAGYKRAEASVKAFNQEQKVGINVSGIRSKITDLQRISPEINQFKTEINGVEVSIQSLYNDLEKVNTQSDFSVVNTRWRAFTDAARAAGIAVTETITKTDSIAKQADKIQFNIDTGAYEAKVESLISRTMQWTDGNGNARTSTDKLKQSLDYLTSAANAYAENKSVENQKKLISAEKELDKQLKTVTSSVRKMNAEYAKDSAIASLNSKIQNFYNNNTAAHRRWGAQLKQMMSETASGAQLTSQRVREIETSFQAVTSAAVNAGKTGKSWFQTLKDSTRMFSAWISPSMMIMRGISEVKKAVSEMKELDNILTEISKTSGMAGDKLKELGISSYDSASKYGRTATDYLTGVQEMARSGFYGNKGEAMAEQSLLAQAAGDMTAELANKYVLATNAAYKYNGAADKLNAVIDGQNMVANRNSVAMADMAAGMSKAGTVASSYNVSIEDLTAMLGTMEAVTKSGGEEVGNAAKSILINIQNITSSKITGTLSRANASMTEMVNGVEKLRNPIEILRDLAETFNKLDEKDPLRAEILTNVGGKYQASKLAALLQNIKLFDKMLVDYSEGTGSALNESNKSAANLTGTLNKLSNTWTKLVNTVINSDGLKTGVNILNSMLQGVTAVTEKLGSLGTIGLGAGLFAGIKNVGRPKMSGLNKSEYADSMLVLLDTVV